MAAVYLMAYGAPHYYRPIRRKRVIAPAGAGMTGAGDRGTRRFGHDGRAALKRSAWLPRGGNPPACGGACEFQLPSAVTVSPVAAGQACGRSSNHVENRRSAVHSAAVLGLHVGPAQVAVGQCPGAVQGGYGGEGGGEAGCVGEEFDGDQRGGLVDDLVHGLGRWGCPGRGSIQNDVRVPCQVPRKQRGTPGMRWMSSVRLSQRSQTARMTVASSTAAEKPQSADIDLAAGEPGAGGEDHDEDRGDDPDDVGPRLMTQLRVSVQVDLSKMSSGQW